MDDILKRLEAEAADWQKCEEAIDPEASRALAELLRSAAAEIKLLRERLEKQSR